MAVRDYLLQVLAVLGTIVLIFVLSGQIYNLYLNLIEFGPVWFYPKLWGILSILILGAVAVLRGRRSTVFYVLTGGLEEWEHYRMPVILWVPYELAKVLIVGWLLESAFFGMTLHGLLAGYRPDVTTALVLFGPLFTALLVRVGIEVLNLLPGLRSDPFVAAKLLMAACVVLALLALRSLSPLLPWKIGILAVLFLAGIIIIKFETPNLIPFFGVAVFAALILPAIVEQFVQWPTHDFNLWASGWENLRFVQVIPPPRGSNFTQQYVEAARLFRNWDTPSAEDKIKRIKPDIFEKYADLDIWFKDNEEFWVAPKLLSFGVSQLKDWESKHITYTSANGISMFNPKTGETMDANQYFRKTRFTYGPGDGYTEWAFVIGASPAGVKITSPLVALFDWGLLNYMPGSLLRDREVTKRVEMIFPGVQSAEPHLYTDGVDTYFCMSLYAELPTTWIAGVNDPFIREIGVTCVNAENGGTKLYRTGTNSLTELIGRYYTLNDMPVWLKDQYRYPRTMFIRQLRVLDHYFTSRVALPDSLKADFILTADGPVLVMPIRAINEEKILGYIALQMGDIITPTLYRLERPIKLPTEVGGVIEASTHRLEDVAVDLGSYLRTGRPSVGRPSFYPVVVKVVNETAVEGRQFYQVPLYVRPDSERELKWEIIVDAETGQLGVGKYAEAAMKDLVG